MAQVTQAQLKRLDAILKRPENHECFDCNSKRPRWASTNLGVFVCLRCAGVHRGLGVHISKVKSTNMDAWEEKMIDCVDRIGNSNGKLLYEANAPPHYRKLDQLCDNTTLERGIRQKYESRQYWAPNYEELYQQMLASPAPPPAAASPQFGQLASLSSASVNRSGGLLSPQQQQQQQQQQGAASQQPSMLLPIVGAAAFPGSPSTNNNNNNSRLYNEQQSFASGIVQGRVVSSSSSVLSPPTPTNSPVLYGCTDTNNNNNKKGAAQLKDDMWGDFTSTPSSAPLQARVIAKGTVVASSSVSPPPPATQLQQHYSTPVVAAANNFDDFFGGGGANKTSSSPTGTVFSTQAQRGSPVPDVSAANDNPLGDWGKQTGSDAGPTRNSTTNTFEEMFGSPSPSSAASSSPPPLTQPTGTAPSRANTNNNSDDFFTMTSPNMANTAANTANNTATTADPLLSAMAALDRSRMGGGRQQGPSIAQMANTGPMASAPAW